MDVRQQRTDRTDDALLHAAIDSAIARKLHRAAQWRLDFISAENSMGFHAPQEAARILGESIDLARQGEVAALRGQAKLAAPPVPEEYREPKGNVPGAGATPASGSPKR